MKKEIIAIAILIIIPVAAVLNLNYINKVTHGLMAELDEAKECMSSGNVEEAEKLVSESLQKWLAKDQYAELYLRHDEVSHVTTSYFQLLAGVERRDATPAMFEAVVESLDGLAEIEHPKLSSIF